MVNGKYPVADVELLVVVLLDEEAEDSRRVKTNLGVIQARWLGQKAYIHVVYVRRSVNERIIVNLVLLRCFYGDTVARASFSVRFNDFDNLSGGVELLLVEIGDSKKQQWQQQSHK